MPILEEISRRFHMLTTDAKPDPPRIPIAGYTHNLPPREKSKSNSQSVPVTPEPIEESNVTSEPKESPPNGAIPTSTEYPSAEQQEQKEQKRPNVKTKTKSRQYKHPQGSNVVNYNIVNSCGVKIGARTSYICNVNQSPGGNSASSDSSKAKFRQMPASVESLSCCTDEITLEDIFVIKTHVGHRWRDVARRLSYSEGQIDQFEENYRHRGVDEVIYQLLLDWKQANTKRAEIGNMVNVLWACQEYDCAERLVTVHKNPS